MNYAQQLKLHKGTNHELIIASEYLTTKENVHHLPINILCKANKITKMNFLQFAFVLLMLRLDCEADDRDHGMVQNRRSFLKYVDEVSDEISCKIICKVNQASKHVQITKRLFNLSIQLLIG